MKIKVIVHEAEEGGFWAEVPSIPGCASQGETFIEGCLSIDVQPCHKSSKSRVVEIAV
jgi:hypothetical protein